ncbi:MAG: glycosyltransferase family 39 protein [Bryobacteraceae bacterium]|jgi:Dolichyl-phosphate-mannose-protein mannosyltransferase
MRQAFVAVVLIAFAVLFIRAARVGLAGDYLDPVAKISAQDEALYSHSAIRMAQRGDWLTPRFLERFALYKPPLAIWLAGISAKLLGVSRIALRLPMILIAALGLGLLFLFAAEMRAWQAGAFAVALLLSNRLWMVPASMVLTDGLLAAFEIAAMYCLFADPWLESRAAFWGFAVSFAAAVLTKGIAAAPLALAFALYCVFAPARRRPTVRRALAVIAAAALFVLPWYAYQAVVHTRWFFAEHFGLEIFSFGAGAPPQTTEENHALFYLKRLVWMDPVLLSLALTALPGWFAELRKRSAEATLVACWLAPMLAAVFIWQYRNGTYLIPCLAPMAVAAAVYAPLPNRSGWWTAALLSASLAMKLAMPAAPWGLSFAAGTIQPAARPLQDYCRMARGNELVVVDLADDLYASTLPLANLRYALVSDSMSGGQLTMDFPSMGITMSAGQFDDFGKWESHFRAILRQWGIDSSEPLARLIVAATPAQMMDVVRAHPLMDFFMPDRYRAAAEAAAGAGHDWAMAPPGYFLLLARRRLPRANPPQWTCAM